jgi:hypothetical protein
MRSAQWNSRRIIFCAVYVLATIQFVWCYLWITRPYVSTALYEQGRERMPFQGRVLMMLPLRWASHIWTLPWIGHLLSRWHFWFPKSVAPEVLVQAFIDVLCLLAAGWFTTRIYEASSRRRIITPIVYPLFLAVCATTYVFHTVQNFRFVYDLPSLAFFGAAMYLLYMRSHWVWFAALFIVATINRETTLLLLPLYALNGAVNDGRFHWRDTLRLQTIALVVPLAIFWGSWQLFIHHHFAHNVSELSPRLNWNVKSLLAPLAWPQLLSAGGYMLLFVLVERRRILDPRLRAWLFLVPIWLVFMFVYGILIETRVFGELIPLIVCTTALIAEEALVARLYATFRQPALAIVEPVRRVEEAA